MTAAIDMMDRDEDGLHEGSSGTQMIELECLALEQLQPSQFYVSEKKLADVMRWFHPDQLADFPAIPVKLLDGVPVMTDGHTRAAAALKAGIEKLPLVWEEDDLDWDMYRVCVDACRRRGIFSPRGLPDRVIRAADYEEQWNRWCEQMQETVRLKRQKG